MARRDLDPKARPGMTQTPTAVRRADMEQDSASRAREAIRAGDTEAALREIEGILAEEKPIHDLYGDMAASVLTFIADRLGEPAVDEAWRYIADDIWKPVLMHFRETGDLESLAQAFAMFLKSHRYDFEVWEDDEKWTFVARYCTSGERMVVEGKVEGAGGDPVGHHRFGATKAAYPWSFDRVGLPYYDVHSALWMKLLPAEWGWAVMDCVYTTKANGAYAVTEYILYKAPR
jgi:hypothetical protein